MERKKFIKPLEKRDKSNKRSEHKLVISGNMASKLKRYAKKKGVSLNHLCGKIIRSFLKKEDK